MSHLIRSCIAFSLGLALVGCANSKSALPFPTALPSADILENQYQRLNHDLSSLPDYRFRIQIPKDWKTLDTHIDEEPAPGELADVAVFRQPGSWMTDAKAPINAEISVSVVNVSGSTLSPADWLQKVLQKNANGFTTIKKRISPSARGEVPDVLITYTAGTESIVSRMMAFRSTGNRMFVITGSDTLKEYPENADAFNVAISTFRLNTPAK